VRDQFVQVSLVSVTGVSQQRIPLPWNWTQSCDVWPESGVGLR